MVTICYSKTAPEHTVCLLLIDTVIYPKSMDEQFSRNCMFDFTSSFHRRNLFSNKIQKRNCCNHEQMLVSASVFKPVTTLSEKEAKTMTYQNDKYCLLLFIISVEALLLKSYLTSCLQRRIIMQSTLYKVFKELFLKLNGLIYSVFDFVLVFT